MLENMEKKQLYSIMYILENIVDSHTLEAEHDARKACPLDLWHHVFCHAVVIETSERTQQNKNEGSLQ